MYVEVVAVKNVLMYTFVREHSFRYVRTFPVICYKHKHLFFTEDVVAFLIILCMY
jgi:hypothetical protein